jgi:hypothetical protein
MARRAGAVPADGEARGKTAAAATSQSGFYLRHSRRWTPTLQSVKTAGGALLA